MTTLHDCIQRESISTLEADVKNMCETMKKHDETTEEFLVMFREKDQPRIDAAHRFIKVFLKVFWLILTPLIAGLGAGIIYAGLHFGKFLGE